MMRWNIVHGRRYEEDVSRWILYHSLFILGDWKTRASSNVSLNSIFSVTSIKSISLVLLPKRFGEFHSEGLAIGAEIHRKTHLSYKWLWRVEYFSSGGWISFFNISIMLFNHLMDDLQKIHIYFSLSFTCKLYVF